MTGTDEGRLAGRVAVVTGAGSGNGAAIAGRLVADGATVVYFDLDADALRKQTAEAPEPERAIPVVGDITVEADVARALSKLDRLDILVNNAGIVLGAQFPDLSVEEFARVMDVNLLGAYRWTVAAFDHLRESEHARVVNTTSIEANTVLDISGGGGQAHYNASKAALASLTRSLAVGCGPLGITVNAVSPGIIATPLNAGMRAGEGVSSWIVGQIPLKRFGDPADIAGAVSFLASDDAAYITGTTILVDGGFTTGWWPPP